MAQAARLKLNKDTHLPHLHQEILEIGRDVTLINTSPAVPRNKLPGALLSASCAGEGVQASALPRNGPMAQTAQFKMEDSVHSSSLAFRSSRLEPNPGSGVMLDFVPSPLIGILGLAGWLEGSSESFPSTPLFLYF